MLIEHYEKVHKRPLLTVPNAIIGRRDPKVGWLVYTVCLYMNVMMMCVHRVLTYNAHLTFYTSL